MHHKKGERSHVEYRIALPSRHLLQRRHARRLVGLSVPAPSLLGATMMVSLSRAGRARRQRRSSQPEAQHPLHHGRRHRLDAAEHLSPRPDGRRNAQHRSHRQRRRDLHGLLRRAELHGRPQRLLHRHASAAHRHDPSATSRAARPICGPAPRRSPSSCSISATTPASSARTIWATTPTRCRPRTASRNTGAICITSMRCRGELPGHQQDPDPADGRAAVQEHADPGSPGSARRGRPEDDGLPDAAAPGAPCKSSDGTRRTRCARTKAR